VRVVDDVSFDVRPGEVFGVVGESGSGKSITMLAVMGLLTAGARLAGGSATLRGQDLSSLAPDDIRQIRGNKLSMIFQDPMTSLNPVLRVGNQIGEIIAIHRPGAGRAEIRNRVIELLRLVGVPNPERRYRQYPHEYSGGMRQRAMIAMAIANDPDVLIADEPTTALDVTIQAQVMEVLAEVRARTGAAMILVTHDLGLVAEAADRVAVMYGGKIMETGGVDDIFSRPRHPYTIGLLASLPRLDTAAEFLYSISGQPPGLADRPNGCVFNPRCGLRQGRSVCASAVPALEEVGVGHRSACHFWREAEAWQSEVHAAARLDRPVMGAQP
jgi:peptide/nickel transport system ATP-binding protein